MRISERCYAVTGLAYSNPSMVNAGFIVGDTETLIVDTGANALAAATIHGYASAVRPNNGLRVVNTEKHFDHIGGNGFFRELDIAIHGHAGIARTASEFAQERSAFHQAFHYGTPLTNPSAPLPAVFELGSCTVEVLATPGHTPTNISLYLPAESILYCGDCLTHLFEPNFDTADPQVWLDSLDRIQALAPQVIVCGHGPIILDEDVPEVIAKVRVALSR